MNRKTDKQNMGYGIFLISLGLSLSIDMFTNFPEWVKISIFGLGGIFGVYLYLTNDKDWNILIPTYSMFAISLIGIIGLNDIIKDDYFGSVVLTLIAAPFLYLYFKNREFWWALIPAYILFSIATMLLLTATNILPDAFIAPFVLYSIAVPFLVLYFKKKEFWWALIPAYTMVIVGTMVALIDFGLLKELIIPAYILNAIALPFFVVYFRNKNNWWALIPGGILGFIGTGFLVSSSVGQIIIPLVLIFFGIYILLRKRT